MLGMGALLAGCCCSMPNARLLLLACCCLMSMAGLASPGPPLTGRAPRPDGPCCCAGCPNAPPPLPCKPLTNGQRGQKGEPVWQRGHSGTSQRRSGWPEPATCGIGQRPLTISF